MINPRAVLGLCAAAILVPRAGADARALNRLHYSVASETDGERLKAIHVTLAFGAPPGRQPIELTLPGEAGNWTAPDKIVVAGAVITARLVASGHCTIRLRPTAGRVAIDYRLLSDGTERLTQSGQHSSIRNRAISIRGEDVFAIPSTGQDRYRASVFLGRAPAGWLLASNLDGTMSLDRLLDGFIAGGATYREGHKRVADAVVRVVYPVGLAAEGEALLEEVPQILRVERRYWRTGPSALLVALVQLDDDAEFSGRGSSSGLQIFSGASISRDDRVRLAAHELLHEWISRRIGGFPAHDSDLEAWLNEGFVEALTPRFLLESGLWSPDQFIDDWNTALARYGTSPVIEAPNARIGVDRQRDPDVNRLPYDRGRLLAIYWDKLIHDRTGGNLGLADVLRAQAASARQSSRRADRLSADKLFPLLVKQITRIDLSPQITLYVDQGRRIALPPDLFGSCASIVSVRQPVFDRGFDLRSTLMNGRRLTGLEPGGPAAQAGLREGDRLLIDEYPTHDSRVTLTYRVEQEHGLSRIVRYRPEGKTTVTFQQVRLNSLCRSATAWSAGLLRP